MNFRQYASVEAAGGLTTNRGNISFIDDDDGTQSKLQPTGLKIFKSE